MVQIILQLSTGGLSFLAVVLSFLPRCLALADAQSEACMIPNHTEKMVA